MAKGRKRRCGPRARHRVRDWAAYDRALARCGDITAWLSPEVVASWRASAWRCTFSDAAISAALRGRAKFQRLLAVNWLP